MPELIDKDLLVRTLRYIAFRDHGNISKIDIDTRFTTHKKVVDILTTEGFLNQNGEISKKGSNFLLNNKLGKPFEANYTPYGVVYEYDNEYLRDLRQILASRPEPNYEIDHQPLLPDLTGMRAHYISSQENLFDKTIAMVGDYDSAGIGINLATRVGGMTIFDIDERLLEYSNKIARERSFPIKCVKQDFFKSMPKKYVGQFDIFVTDPPYTMVGMKKFIEFGLKLLKDDGIGYIAVPYHESISWTERMLYEVNMLVMNQGCVITDIIKNFHRYGSADGLRSSMVRIKKGSNLKPINTKNMYSYKLSNINVPIVEKINL